MDEPALCANCEAVLHGRWCHACGQRRSEPGDRTLRHLVGQAAEALTDLDSRFWRSLRTLMLQPGRLSADYLAGRRQRWLSPISLFLLANLVYFLAPVVTDFELPFGDHASGALRVAVAEARHGPLDPTARERLLRYGGQFHSEFTGPWVEARIAARDAAASQASPPQRYTAQDFASAYNQRRGEVSKLLIVLHMPALALLLWLLHPRSGFTLAEHTVVGLHLFTWLVLAAELLVPLIALVELLGLPTLTGWIGYGFAVALVAYTSRSLQVVYGRGWIALPLALVLLAGLVAFSIVVYRTLQFLIIAALV